MYFSLLFQSYRLSFSQRKVASFFSYFSQDILKVCFSKIFQDFSISSRIFRNLSFAKEGDLLFLLLPRSSKVCLFQDVPKFSKIFQNVPKGCFSQHLLRVFSLFTSTVSQSFFFRSFPDFPGVFWDSPGVFHWLSNTLYTGNRWGGQFWFPVWFTELLHLHIYLVRLVDIGYIRFCG